MSIKAFLFDMDGTLLDSMPLWRSTNRVVLEHYKYPIDAELEAHLPVYTSMDIAVLLKAKGIAEIDEVISLYVEHMLVHYMTDIKSKPGAAEFLSLLRDKGVRVFLASATPSNAAAEALERQGLLQYFEDLIDDTRFGVNKGNPEFFRRLSESIGLEPHECAMFEDSLYAIESAKAAGCCVYAISDEVASRVPGRAESIRAASDVYVNDFFEAVAQFVNAQ